MNHDIAHCDAQYYIFDKHGECKERSCALRTKCKRHKAYLDLKSDEKYPVTYISAYECVIKDHELYCEEKE